MQPISLVKLAQILVNEAVNPGDFVIDATVGNGHDTRFLLELVKPDGNVFGFDIQQTAIDSTLKKIPELSLLTNLTLMNTCHSTISENIPLKFHGKINAVMFNLGYLPGSDKQIITSAQSTLTALAASCKLLIKNGIITILAYPGHEGGDLEAHAVMDWCQTLDSESYEVSLYESYIKKPLSPQLFVVRKISYDGNRF
jgi:Putative rRNA methylase